VEYTITPELAQDFRALMTRVPARRMTPHSQSFSGPMGYAEFLRAESPPPKEYFPRPMSPPLFPRSETVGNGRKITVLGGVRVPESFEEILDIVGAQPTRVENEGFSMDEIAQENMRMLCGDMGERISFG
jgi:hypothetical protein